MPAASCAATLRISFKENKMDLDNFQFSEHDEAESEAARERQLLADEVPLNFTDADDCGDACKI